MLDARPLERSGGIGERCVGSGALLLDARRFGLEGSHHLGADVDLGLELGGLFAPSELVAERRLRTE